MYQNVLSFYGIIAAYLLGAGLVSWFFGFLWIKIVGTLSARTRGDLDNQLVLVSHRPFTFFIFFILLGMGKEMAQEAPGFQEAKLWGKVEQITYVALILVLAWWIDRIIGTLMNWFMQKSTTESTEGTNSLAENHMFRMVRQILRVMVYFVALTIILGYFNISISGLVATAGVASLAVALAAQETLGNMLAGLMIMLDKPYKVGDRIESKGLLGDVVDIGARSTRLKTLDNTIIVIPNTDLAASRIVNYNNPTPRAVVRLHLGISYDADLQKAKDILLEIMQLHPDVLPDPEPAVYFLEFAESSLNLQCICSIEDFKDKFKVMDELNMDIKRRFAENQIEIPYPQRDIHVHAAEGLLQEGETLIEQMKGIGRAKAQEQQ